MTTPEGRVQDALQKAVRLAGGVVRKTRYEGRVGCPDLFCFMPKGRLLMVECKRPGGGKLSSGQVQELAVLFSRGFRVRVYDGKEDANDFLQRCLREQDEESSWNTSNETMRE